MKYRIAKPDPLNWTIEEFQEGGKVISRGPHAGKLTEELWKPAKCFYPTLKLAALALIDKAAGDALLTGEATTILEAIQVAERSVQATLAVCFEMGVAPPTPAKE